MKEDVTATDFPGMPGIIIDYGTIEGFRTTVRLFPENRMTDVSCQALIDLEHEGKHRVFMHDVYCDPDMADTLASGTVLKREYQLPAGANERQVCLEIFSEMPFFFLDVDFDGEKELVLNLYRQGQKWSNAYKPIRLEHDYLYDNLKQKPFTDLDDHSTIDYDTNTIKIYTHFGAMAWLDDIYTYNKEEESVSGPKLISHVTIEYDTWDENDKKKRIITERKDTTEWMAAGELINH